MKHNKTDCFVAGHSGGHIIPCITLAQEKCKKDSSAHILFFSTMTSLDIRIARETDTPFTIIHLPIPPLTNKNPLQLAWILVQNAYAFCISLFYLVKEKPKSVTSSGGIASVPICLAAYLLKIPIDLYELNVLPGKTTYFLSPLARTIFCCFEKTISFLPNAPCKFAHYPIRTQTKESKEKLYRQYGLDPLVKTLFIIGGSQGSVIVNNALKKIIENKWIMQPVQIIHQTGSLDTTNWKHFYRKHGIMSHVFDFTAHTSSYYAIADLVICRSGAGALFEALAHKKSCLTIPLETDHNNHQIHNAYTMAQLHPDFFEVMSQSDIQHKPKILAHLITKKIVSYKTKHTHRTTPKKENAL